jgi:predicted transcriptional regulator
MNRHNYNPMESTATRLITKFGAVYKFERQVERDYDPETGKPVSRKFIYTGEAAISEFTKSEIAQNTVQDGEIKLMAEAQDYKIGDLVSVDSLQYRIVSVSPIRKSQQVLAVYLHLRK